MALPIFYGASLGNLFLVLAALLVMFAAPLAFNDGFLQQIMQTIAFYTIAAQGDTGAIKVAIDHRGG